MSYIARVFFGALLLLASSALALSIGDKPELKRNALDGRPVDLAALKGKLVVIDFWAGRLVTGQRNETRLLEVYGELNKKGLEIIGVNCDEKVADAREHIAALKLPWPIIHERDGVKGALGRSWGIPRLPYYIILDPAGAVVYAGYKSAIDDIVIDEFLAHPPPPVSAEALEKAKRDLAAADKLLSEGDRIGALRTFASIDRDAVKDPSFKKEHEALAKKFEQTAADLLADVEPLVASKHYADAVTRLKDLSFTGCPKEADARKQLADLLARDEVKSALAAAARESAANTALSAARILRTQGEHDAAYRRFSAIVKDHPNTAAARSAAEAVAQYESDPEFIRRQRDKLLESQAKPKLTLADNYRQNGLPDKARAKYHEILKEFPNTTFAQAAQKALDEMK